MPARMWKDAAGVVLFLLVLTAVTWRTYARVSPEGVTGDPRRTALGDFREVIYYPTQAVLGGVNPYDNRLDDIGRYRNRYPVGNVFPLYHPLIFVLGLPFALLPLPVAEVAFWLLNVALLLLLSAVAWRFADERPNIARVSLLATLLLLSRPGHANLYFGQLTLLVTLASAAALHFARSRPWLAGLALAIATIKPTFGGPVALLMLARRDFRAGAIGLLLSGVSAVGGFGAIASRDVHGESPLAVLLKNQSGTNADPAVDPARSGSRIDLPLVAERLLGPASRTFSRVALPLLLIAAASAALWRLSYCATSDARRLSDSLILATMALCIYHNIYDALLLVLPVMWLFSLCRKGDKPVPTWLSAVALAAFCVPAVNYLSSQKFNQLLHARFALRELATSAVAEALWTSACVANGIALFCGWLLLVVMAFRWPRPAAR